MEEEAGVYAAKAAYNLVNSLVGNSEYNLAEDVQKLREIREQTRLGPSTANIVEEAQKEVFLIYRLNKQSLVQLGYGINQKRFRATIAGSIFLHRG
ncbi:MAG: hypothetical protein WKF59_25945 [Chitinophagaceae bacterium]